MAETGSGIRVRLRRMAGSYPGSRGSGMGGLTENDDSCRLERLDGGVEWSPLRVILYIYIYICAYAPRRGTAWEEKETANWLRWQKKRRKKEKDRQNEAIGQFYIGLLVLLLLYGVFHAKCNAMQANEGKTQQADSD